MLGRQRGAGPCPSLGLMGETIPSNQGSLIPSLNSSLFSQPPRPFSLLVLSPLLWLLLSLLPRLLFFSLCPEGR